MLVMNCPFCGPRDESEFVHGGPATDARPENTEDMSDAAWIDYLIVPPNPMGPVKERWWHVRGCGRWLVIERNTVTHEIS